MGYHQSGKIITKKKSTYFAIQGVGKWLIHLKLILMRKIFNLFDLKQQVDYKIKVSLDEVKRRLTGSEKITYQNNSPYRLKYLWVQLDQNIFKSRVVDAYSRP